MNKKHLIWVVFICVVIIQISVPLYMITRREVVLRNGVQFRFKTQPVDPYDAFRGKYVALRLAEDKAPLPTGVRLERKQKVYAHLIEDEKGFAKVASISRSRPKGSSYIKSRVKYVSGGNVHLDMPFDRYYMEEKSAPAAEAAYRKHSVRGKHDAYVAIRVKSGFAVIEELYIAGKPIMDYIKENRN